MKAKVARQVVVRRPVRRSFGGGGASFWICVLLMMCTLRLCPFGSNVGAELSRDGLLLLNFSNTNSLGNRLGRCQGEIGTWNASDDTPCGWVRVFCNAKSAVHRLDFSGCDMSEFLIFQPLDELGSLQELDLSSNPSFLGSGLLESLTPFTGLTWLDISGSGSLSVAVPWNGSALLTTLGRLQYLYADGGVEDGFFPYLKGLRELVVLSCANSGLNGDIPEELSSLSKLVSLDLSSNIFQGSVPNLEGLTRLTQLSLPSNHLSGDVPSAPNLQYLDAGDNSFTNLTDAFFQMSDLRRLNLSRNQLGGPLSDIMGRQFTRLELLDLSSNILRGPIPSTLPHVVNYLDLSNNNLSGPIPSTLPHVVNYLDLSNNNLSGPIPSTLPHVVKYLDLSNNNLSGPIPSTLPHVIKYLNLSNNNLFGPIPPEFQLVIGNDEEVDGVAWLDLSGNELNGSIPASSLYPAGAVECYVNLSGNSLVGSIPDYPFQRNGYVPYKQICTLDLSDNQLSGPLPFCFKNSYFNNSAFHHGNVGDIGIVLNIGSFFSVLWLQNNQIYDDLIPLLSLQKPLSIRVQGNRFTGDLTKLLDSGEPLLESQSISVLTSPLTLVWDLSHNDLTMRPSEKFPNPLQSMLGLFCSDSSLGLKELRLAGSDLMGQPLPGSLNCSQLWDSLQVMDSLEVLDLGGCNLSGPVPQALFNDFITNLTFLNVSNNKRLSGSIPTTLPDTLRQLDLGNCNMEGEMPPTLFTGLPNLFYFNASNNKLSGPIPGTFPLALQVLDLSHNNLTGEIPPIIFFALPNLKYIDLSGNNLSGSIPVGLPGAVYTASSFADNPGLCGGPLQPCIIPQAPAHRGLVIKEWVLVIIVVAVVLVCTGSCLLVFWKWKVYSKKHQQDAELIATLLERGTVTVMPLRELRKATSNFSESAQIGVGGFGTVYTGELADGTAVAIKKGKREGSPEYKQQFLNEVRILSGVNHRHLVKLLGCSMENKVALLVFEFVSNGTLKEHLQGKRPGCCPLSWRQRLLIALQTSDALAYLHSAADPPIIHRDVKSSNILLDHDLNAKVADFGISKLVPSSAATHVSTVAVQGTMGYIDPEYYVSSRLTPRSDVYSFGVVLLELISAKPAVDFRGGEDDEASLVILAFSARDRGEWEGLIDPMLADTYSSDHGKVSIESVGALAIRCLALKSRERPDMKEVWKVLQTVWLGWDSDTSVQPDDGQHDVHPLLLPYSDVSDSYDSMSLQSSQASLRSSSTTSGPQVEMQHPRFQTV